MATGDILNIWNRALGSIGARSGVQSINEASTEANACNLFFQSTFEALGRTAKWNCLDGEGQLSLLWSAPGTPTNPQGLIKPYPPGRWRFQYAQPPDCLFVRRVLVPPYTNNATGASGVPIFPVTNYVAGGCGQQNRAIPFKCMVGVDSLGNNVQTIVTDAAAALCEYNKNIANPALWDSLFQQAMVSSLSVFLCMSVSGDKAQAQVQKATAKDMIDQARAADGNEGTITQNREASWIEARNGETGPWSLGFNGPYLNYDNMPWPW